MQIILDGSLHQTTVVRQRQDVHELLISSAVYDLKPIGDHDGVPRISIDIELFSTIQILFESSEALLASQPH